MYAVKQKNNKRKREGIEMQEENKVARILQYYGILNGIACIFIAIILGVNGDPWIIFLAAGFLSSFLIYAFGEVVQLLQDIKNNGTVVKDNSQNPTRNDSEPANDEIPEL